MAQFISFASQTVDGAHVVGRGAKSSSLDEVNHSGKSMPKGGSGCGTDTGIESLSGSKACRGAFGRDNIGL